MAGNNQLGGKPIEHAPVGDKAVQAPLEAHPQLHQSANLANPESNAHIASMMKGDTGKDALAQFGNPGITGMDGKDLVAAKMPGDSGTGNPTVVADASSTITKQLRPQSVLGNDTLARVQATGDDASLVANGQMDNIQV